MLYIYTKCSQEVNILKNDIIVHFGMGFLPEGNAVASRQQAISHMITECGYTPVLIGICKDVAFGEYKKEIHNDVVCYSVKYASSLLNKAFDSFSIKKTFLKIFEDIGIDRIKCFIMQDYQFNAMRKMKNVCHKNGIAFAADLMDWFTPTRDYSISKNIFKSIDMFIRANFLYPSLKNKIYVSSKFAKRFNKPKRNELIFPCTCKDIENTTNEALLSRKNITITFAGEPGSRFQKEKIDWVVQALYENASSIDMNIIGITKDTFVSRSPKMEKYLTDHIHFFGRIPRHECISVIKNSDFSIVPRLSNNLTMYGFSTKICESFVCGIPVIATDTSDNKKYIIDGENGFVCDANYESLKQLLNQIDKLDRKSIIHMHQSLSKSNPLSTKQFMNCFSSFIKNLII